MFFAGAGEPIWVSSVGKVSTAVEGQIIAKS
jgi:hypothetical protein